MRHDVFVATSIVVLAAAGAAVGAPGVYAQRQISGALAGGVLPAGAAVGIHVINGLGLSVPQRVAGTTNQSASVAVCLSASRTKVGHYYGVKTGSTYAARCYVDGGQENGAQIIQPTDTQRRNVKWAPLAKGQALPKAIAPVEYVGPRRVPLFVCKSGSTPLLERIGTLLPDGSCRLAPSLTEQASTVNSSSVLLWSATGNAAPRYGWITVARDFHHPGGELLKWPSGLVYCVANGTPGELAPAQGSSPAGSVGGCRIRVPGGTSIEETNIRVFRNNAQSGAGWAPSGGTEMSEPNGTPCVASDNGQGVKRAGMTFCETPGGGRTNFKTLRRTGSIPGEGDAG
jgi:hypothetical protein